MGSICENLNDGTAKVTVAYFPKMLMRSFNSQRGGEFENRTIRFSKGERRRGAKSLSEKPLFIQMIPLAFRQGSMRTGFRFGYKKRCDESGKALKTYAKKCMEKISSETCS